MLKNVKVPAFNGDDSNLDGVFIQQPRKYKT